MKPNLETNRARLAEIDEEADKRFPELRARTIDMASDMWAVGVTAAQLFGQPPFLQEGPSDAARIVREFGADRQNVAVAERGADGALPKGALMESTGIPAVDFLLNLTLCPLPGDRISASQFAAVVDPIGAGLSSANDLANILHRNRTTDPADRAGIEEMYRYFTNPQIGSQEARNLYLALKSDNKSAIDHARSALAQVN